MPTYEYACRECDHHFEIFQSMKAESLIRCPECDRDALHRLIGRGAGIIFKGSGFYETDYRREASSAQAGEKASSEKAASGESSSGEKTSSSVKSSGDTSSSSSSGSKTQPATSPANS